MHTVAILGAGELGGALARTLAAGDAVSHIVLDRRGGQRRLGQGARHPADGAGRVVRHAVDGSDDIHQAPARTSIVVADRHGRRRSSAEAALALLDRVARMAPAAPLVFSGAADHALMTLAIKELKLSTARLIGSAPVAAAAAAPRADAPRHWTPRRWTSRSRCWACRLSLGAGVGWRACSAGRPWRCRRTRRRVSSRRSRQAGPRAVQPGLGRRGCDPGDAHGLAPALLLLSGDAFGGIHPVVFAAPVTLGPSGIRSVRASRAHTTPARRARVNGARTNLSKPTEPPPAASIWSGSPVELNGRAARRRRRMPPRTLSATSVGGHGRPSSPSSEVTPCRRCRTARSGRSSAGRSTR